MGKWGEKKMYIQEAAKQAIEKEKYMTLPEFQGGAKEGILSDKNGDALKLYYNQSTKKVYVRE